jgi:hypothetical protein
LGSSPLRRFRQRQHHGQGEKKLGNHGWSRQGAEGKQVGQHQNRKPAEK